MNRADLPGAAPTLTLPRFAGEGTQSEATA
jgi:hypothetical protein